MKEKYLTYEEAMVSPCAACKHSPCCSLLQLDALQPKKLLELDKINFYLNFEHIEICLTAAWEWLIYYSHPCRYFDPEKSICRIHDTGQQPGVCVHYNPYNCLYKKLDRTRFHFSKEMIWINRERMNALLSQLSFDEDRKISEIPELGKLYETMSRIPYQVPEKVAVSRKDTKNCAGEAVVKTHLDFRNPCRDCDSYCCKSLMLPQPVPTTYSSLDFNRYALSYPGVELGISDDQWYIIASTKCRHLEGKRCAVYEKQERPLICRYYNAMQCDHKSYFGKEKPDGFLRVDLEEFNWLIETFRFDEQGNIIDAYDIRSLRSHIEAKTEEKK